MACSVRIKHCVVATSALVLLAVTHIMYVLPSLTEASIINFYRSKHMSDDEKSAIIAEYCNNVMTVPNETPAGDEDIEEVALPTSSKLEANFGDKTTPPPPLNISIHNSFDGDYGVGAFCYDPSGNRVLHQSDLDKLKGDNGAASKSVVIYDSTSPRRHMFKLGYGVTDIFTPVVLMDFGRAKSDNVYHYIERIFPLFSKLKADDFQWSNKAAEVEFVHWGTRGELKKELLPFFDHVTVGGDSGAKIRFIEEYIDEGEKKAVCFRDPIHPFLAPTFFNSQPAHARFREVAYKLCGVSPPSSPPPTNRTTLYQRTRSRKLLNVEKVQARIQAILGESWEVDVVPYSKDMPVCELVEQFANTALLISPHGFQLSNLVLLPPGAQVLEVFPPGYRPRMYQKLTGEIDKGAYWSTVSSIPLPSGAGCNLNDGNCRGLLRGMDVQINLDHLPVLLEGMVEQWGGKNQRCEGKYRGFPCHKESYAIEKGLNYEGATLARTVLGNYSDWSEDDGRNRPVAPLYMTPTSTAAGVAVCDVLHRYSQTRGGGGGE